MSRNPYAGIKPCRSCGVEFDYRGGHRLCAPCKASGAHLQNLLCHQCGREFGYWRGEYRCAACKRKGKFQCPVCLQKDASLHARTPCGRCVTKIGWELPSPVEKKRAQIFLLAALSGVVLSVLDFVPSGVAGAVVALLLAVYFALWPSARKEKGRNSRIVGLQIKEQALAESRWLINILGMKPFAGKGTPYHGEHYVYLHFVPKTNKVVYVGKGVGSRDQSVERTLPEHRALLEQGKLRVCRVMTDVSEEVALNQESYFIGQYERRSKGGTLFNVQGGTRSPRNYLKEAKPDFSGQSARPILQDFPEKSEALDQLISRYLSHLARSGRTQEYIRKVKGCLRRIFRDLEWDHIGNIDAYAFVNWLDSRSLARSTKKHYRTSLHGFCEWAVQAGALETNPFSWRQ